ncbi:MAG: hypothetical protein LBO62_07005 [Endomicrobium sp.]|nr:hypothetical protein [Endomicrobium sp.]
MSGNIDSSEYNKDFLHIAQYAIKAPSGHNTQPWKFKINENSIEILPNFTKSLPAVDESNRELYISLGCALENLRIAARHLGYNYDIAAQNEQGIIVNLVKASSSTENSLYSQIEKRQTNRSVYNNQKIPDETIKYLENIILQPNTQVYFAKIGENFANSLTQYILRGNEIQMNDNDFKDELILWMRFNKREVKKTQDGLAYNAMGFPAIARFLGKLIVGAYLKPDKQNKADLKKINSSSHFLLFTTKNNTVFEWIDLGRTLERILLETTRLNLANAYMNPPCEIEVLANEIKNTLTINNEYPAILLRIGYAQPMPYSHRVSSEMY